MPWKEILPLSIHDAFAEQDHDDEWRDIFHATNSRQLCAKCQGQHYTSKCKGYKELSPADRLQLIREKRLCVLCLAAGHFSNDCQFNWRCQEKGCGMKHHTSLHAAFQPRVDARVDNQQTSLCTTSHDNIPEGPDVHLVDHVCAAEEGPDSIVTSHQVFGLPLTPVLVKGPGGVKSTYALLDSGSTMSLCSERLMKEVGLKPKGSMTTTVNTVTGAQDIASRIVDVNFIGLEADTYLLAANVCSVKTLPISRQHQMSAEHLKKWSHFKDLNLPVADTSTVDLLIGQNNAHLLEPVKKVKGNSDEPYAILTPVGWMLYGLTAGHSIHSSYFVQGGGCYVRETSTVLNANEEIEQANLETLLERFWHIEEPPRTSKMSRAEQLVIDKWNREEQVVDGHLILPVPFKNDQPDLPNNIRTARGRLQQLGKRLMNDAQLLDKYKTAMEKNIKEGYAEEVVSEEKAPPGKEWYIPHHPVTHARKPGKVRIVFDCSATHAGTSLNKNIHQGPDLTSNLVKVLTRFRLYPSAITACWGECMDACMVFGESAVTFLTLSALSGTRAGVFWESVAL